ncbi:MAG: restriction endonuclease subunit S [Candidatus Thiodiazotropha sp. (ex Epidulcina cf. delphinae)]|nr:restriction endonuclease subunit S [Candidatus Thiodiazotropha sp. (ex Epidulcina cf. delphinae)]
MSNWEVSKLHDWVIAGDIELGRGDIISKDDINNFPGPYPIYSSSAHRNGKFGEYAKYMFDEELITWSVDGGGNFFYRPKHKFSVTNVCGYMRIKTGNLHAPFIYYCLSGQHRYLTFDYTTKAHPSVIRRLYWLPRIEVVAQQKIAHILQTIDQTIEKTAALIEKYQQIKAGLMHDLFTRGIGADGKLRPLREQAPELYQQTPIGWIPKEWEPLKLKDILERFGGYLQTGPFGSQLHAHEYTHEGIPVVMPQDINEGKIEEAQIARIAEYRAQSLLKHRLKASDIIIARRGELSRAAAITSLERGWVCGTGCFLLRLGGTDLDARFFSHMYQHTVIQQQVAGLAVGTTMPSLNNEIMGKLIFPYMSKVEQSLISDKVDLVTDKVTTLRLELAKLYNKKSGLMHDLLTGKVQVQQNEPEVLDGL